MLLEDWLAAVVLSAFIYVVHRLGAGVEDAILVARVCGGACQ
jgi:hypothetical protein